MKKLVSVLTVCSLVFLLCSCAHSGRDASLSLTADKKEVTPGETISVTVNAKDIENFAAGDIAISSTDKAVFKDCDFSCPEELISEGNMKDGKYVVSLYTARTIDMADTALCTLTYTVDEKASHGDKIKFSLELISFDVGTDDSGDETVHAADKVKAGSVTVTVK